MINPNSQQVFELSDYFHQLGNALGEYIQRNKTSLKDDERNDLIDQQIELLRISGEINIIGVSLVFEDVQASLKQMDFITEAVKETVKKTLAVQDAIKMAAAIVGIGTAILSEDPELFLKNYSAAAAVMKTINCKKI